MPYLCITTKKTISTFKVTSNKGQCRYFSRGHILNPSQAQQPKHWGALKFSMQTCLRWTFRSPNGLTHIFEVWPLWWLLAFGQFFQFLVTSADGVLAINDDRKNAFRVHKISQMIIDLGISSQFGLCFVVFDLFWPLSLPKLKICKIFLLIFLIIGYSRGVSD